MKRSKKYSPRHAPSFILLFVARGPTYGGAILKMMEEEIPYFMGDSSMVYRTLQELEEEGSVISEWDMPDAGRPIKNYTITQHGWNQLFDAEEDIRRRTENHFFFLNELGKVKKEKKE